MAKKKRTGARTAKKDWKPVFINELARRGNVVAAVARAKVGRQTVYDARSADPAFAAAWDEAIAIADELMEAEARRRAVEGTLRPVFQGGEEVGRVREYSDTLLIFLLKAHKPEKYRDNSRVVVAGDPANPLKHDHVISTTDRIDQLAAAFAGVADRTSEGRPPGDGPGEPVDPGAGEGRSVPEAG